MTGSLPFPVPNTPAPLRRRSSRSAQVQPPIDDYALIGNTHSAALVSREGSIDWCCLPHFDSGAVFCRLLDVDKGGFFRVGPVDPCTSSRRYVDGTAVLQTELTTHDGRVRLTDFMHSQRIVHSRLGIDDAHCHRLLRLVEGVEGALDLELVLRPTFDFARRASTIHLLDTGALVTSAHERLRLYCSPPCAMRISNDAVCARLRLQAGDRFWLVLSHDDESESDPELLLEETLRHWREWDGLCTYEGPYHDLVRHSARVLKLLTFGPTGAIIAAPTTSLPEEIGGVRNWDYRYCWLRDSALILHSLMSIGYHEAAMDFFHWMEGLCDGDCEELQIMFRLDGGRELPERELRHLLGYLSSAPVRIGNGAARQKQLDVYGHVLDAVHLCVKDMNMPIREGLWRVLRHLADEAARRWHETDRGIWEIRGEPRHFLSSKLMCWVALDRAVRLARAGELTGDATLWQRERDAVRAAIFERGYDGTTFTQAFGTSALDASALLIPLVGFLPATDPRMRATVDRIRKELTDHGLVYRYLTDDGLPGGEATFAICSFWLVDNLALQGRIDEARELFEHVASFRSDLGLLAEEIDPRSGALLGNYPQGFTHLALIKSALTIARMERNLQQRR